MARKVSTGYAANDPVQLAKLRARPHPSSTPVAELAETFDPNRPLSEKQKLFVKHWAKGESVATAAARAGYEGTTHCYRLIHYPQAIALYQAEKAAFEKANDMSRKRVMDGLLEAIDMAKMTSDPHAMVSGWKTVAQMCGYMEPIKRRLEINVTGNIAMDRINSMSDAELLRLMQETVVGEVLQIEHEEAEDEG